MGHEHARHPLSTKFKDFNRPGLRAAGGQAGRAVGFKAEGARGNRVLGLSRCMALRLWATGLWEPTWRFMGSYQSGSN